MPKIDTPSTDEITISEEPKAFSKKKKRARPILTLVIVVIILIIVGFFITRLGGGTISIGKGNNYQAVFLINGQVYFGHVTKENKDQVVLHDIYYLRVTEPLQQGEQAGQPSSELSLIKLGNELHGPKDEMRIVRNNILFIEDLEEDSKVTTAIEEYIASQEE